MWDIKDDAEDSDWVYCFSDSLVFRGALCFGLLCTEPDENMSKCSSFSSWLWSVIFRLEAARAPESTCA
jgi:hypothetical protein